MHGLYWLVANLAVRAAVVLAVDDLHRADEPSLRWLIYLCHRLERLPVLLVATTRCAAAREPSRRALDLAAPCGATPLTQRVREEALAAGARPRRPLSSGVHALPPSELRVARLAAQSLGNREIAQALFITTKTVSDHLTSAYRKLNISSRDQLATAMNAPTFADLSP